MTVYSYKCRRAARPVALLLWGFCLLCQCVALACIGLQPALAAEALPPATTASERDILGVAQDLAPFARKAGQDRVLLSAAEQAERDARSNQLFFSPWEQAKPSLSAKEFRAHILRKPRGFCMDVPWSAEAWKELVHNTNTAAYPRAKGPAIVTRHADMRSMPTDKPLFMEGTATPTVDYFDFFQHASLALGTPVYVSHSSADGKWLYVEYPLLSGWLRTADVAMVSRADARAYTTGSYAVVVRDGTVLPYTGEGGTGAETGIGPTYIGSVFPYAADSTPTLAIGAGATGAAGLAGATGVTSTSATTAADPATGPAVPLATGATGVAGLAGATGVTSTDAGRDIMVPVRNSDGTARMVRVRPPQGSVLPKPLPLTPKALTALGAQMLGQPYGWGGIKHNRDCSLAMRDLFLPFGIWLARNSRTQVQVGSFRKLTTLSPEARKAAILRDAVPFMTLLGFPGHVGLYVGAQDGEPIMLHNILGLRTNDAEQNFRHIIAKGILSTLEPGKNQPELQLRETLLERVRAIRHLP